MKTLSTAIAVFFLVALSLALVSCQGLTLTANPDGSIGGSYVPTKPLVIPAK